MTTDKKPSMIDEAYDIRGRGVGRLNLDKAMKSKLFLEKARKLAKQIDKMKWGKH